MSILQSSLLVIVYFLGLLAFIHYLRTLSHQALMSGRVLLALGVIGQVMALLGVLGGKETLFPTNPQESYVFTTTILAAASFLLSWRKSSISILLILLPLMAGLIVVFHNYNPPQVNDVTLHPWIWIHIILMLVGEALFLLSAAVSVVYLLAEMRIRNKRLNSPFTRFVSLNVLDRLLGETLLVGFVLLSAGMLLGIFFASSLWTSSWLLDPKFLVCLLTWVIFAVLLVRRWREAGFRGRRSAWAACVGVLVLIFLVLGVETFFKTQHLNFGNSPQGIESTP